MSRALTFTHPIVFAAAAAGKAHYDPETDPTRIDWPARQAAAAIPFEVVDGRPVNPHGPTGFRYGRNRLGHWGEKVCADALVIATDQHGWRYMAMVERRDGNGWALPGGKVDPGENPTAAAFRELREETGLIVHDSEPHMTLPARYVPDPRASDEAWMVTVATRIDLAGVFRISTLPPLVAADDARRAAWIPALSYDTAAVYLRHVYGGTVFAAHHALLADLLTR
ncbi:NUDIX domain-containing protein [Micromonospora echinospora]|uniref:NUDIX domain-containing protein n=1 Tax=Micromonospora echinospora TaxID=1877 RepID=UPI0033D1B249